MFEEVRILTDFYIQALQQHINLALELEKQKSTLQEAKEGLNRKAATCNVVPTGNDKFMRATMVPESNILDILERVDSGILRDDPLDAVIQKLYNNNITLDAFYERLDGDGDGVLTMMEIRTHINEIDLDLTP